MTTLREKLTLKGLIFHDLIFHEKKDLFLVRHTSLSDKPLISLPLDYVHDAVRLRQKCMQYHVQTNLTEFFCDYDKVPYRVARMQTIDDIVYFLRRPTDPLPSLDDFGYKKSIVEVFKWLGRQKSRGFILLSGPTGAGKTTSIYAVLQYYMQQYGDIIISMEDPPEIMANSLLRHGQDSAAWYQIDIKDYGSYENAFKASMRYDPRYIFIGEIRDPSVAHWAIRAAVNGHVVLSTIHANSVIGAIFSLMQIASSNSEASQDLVRAILAEGLTFVLHQTLSFNGQSYFVDAEVLYLENDFGARSKIRTGKIEQLSTEVAMQKMIIDRGASLIKDKPAGEI